MEIYIVEYNGKFSGCYTDYDLAETFVLSCLTCGLMVNNAVINKYKSNSCVLLESKTISNNKISTINITSNIAIKEEPEVKPIQNKIVENLLRKQQLKQTNPEPIKKVQFVDKEVKTFASNVDRKQILKLNKKKAKIRHKINIIKNNKERIDRCKSIFENDIKLFNQFKEQKEKDSSFVLPDLFIKKFEVMTMLNNENRLDFNTFVDNFQTETLYNEYYGLNDLDMSLSSSSSEDEESKDNKIEEVFEINTESSDEEIESESSTGTSDSE